MGVLIALALARQEPAGDAERPRAEANTARDYVRFAYNFYDQKDGGGNPNLEEDMTVLEPQLLVSKTLSDAVTATFRFQVDYISAASVERGKRFPPGTQSGASGDKYYGGEGALFYAWSDRTTVGGGLSASDEYDYQSLGGFLKWSHDTADRNDTFVVRAGAFRDNVELIFFDGMEGASDETRTSLTLGLGWTHVFGPRTLGTLNWDLTTQSGFLSTPYNSVVAAGTEVREILPDSRFRNSFHARVRHLIFDDLAAEPGAGFYVDDWGATAFNFELALYWELIPSVLIVRPWYRYHSQTEVDDFLPTTATAIPEFRTQDSDLADVDSHTIGVKILVPLFKFLGESQEFEIGVDRTSRSDDLDSTSLSAGWQWRF